LLLIWTHTDALLAASPDFQTKLGYALPAPGGANLSTASKANAQKYNTLSLVLEQPFKDTIGEGQLHAPGHCYRCIMAYSFQILQHRRARFGCFLQFISKVCTVFARPLASCHSSATSSKYCRQLRAIPSGVVPVLCPCKHHV
jgi:hypothetical protein